MTDPVAAPRLRVWRNGQNVGSLTRTRHGCVFEIDTDWVGRATPGTPDLAVRIPNSSRTIETHGVNLPPFFAGLLPEGLRLRALVRTVKTSEDDLFSLLAAVGADTIGDLTAGPGDAEPAPQEIEADADRTSEVYFCELLARSLDLSGSAGHGWSVAGVQPKISAGRAAVRVCERGGSGGWILKLGDDEHPRLVENEAYFLGLSRACGLVPPEFRVVVDRDGIPGLLVRRFDRIPRILPRRKRIAAAASGTDDVARRPSVANAFGSQVRPAGPLRVHVEDACQFLDRYPADKYRLSLREIADGLSDVCAAPVPAVAWLMRLHAFSWAIGNGDLHAKNVSVLRDPTTGTFVPAPAYDLLSTLPYGDDRMALALDGRDRDLRRADFVAFAGRFGVRPAATEALLDHVVRGVAAGVASIPAIGFDERRTRHLTRTISARLDTLARTA